MAPRGKPLGAHDRRDPLARCGLEAVQPLPKVLRLHVIGVSAERGVHPSGVRGILARVASPAELAEVPVSDVGGLQRPPQRRLLVLRIVAGARNRAHVHDLLDPVRLQQL